MYITDGFRARLLYSASHFRSYDKNYRALIGRANRFLHWEDMVHLKKYGMSIYDMGGIGANSIAGFKKGFGGTEVTEYGRYEPRTLLGKLSLRYLQRVWSKSDS